MKKQDYILAYILALTISFAVCYSHYNQKISAEHIQIGLGEIKSSTGQIEALLLKKYNTKILLDKIDELTRLNVWLEMENAAQKDEIREFGWLKPAMDKEGVNP
jgi:hypothetical protein